MKLDFDEVVKTVRVILVDELPTRRAVVEAVRTRLEDFARVVAEKLVSWTCRYFGVGHDDPFLSLLPICQKQTDSSSTCFQ
jgi:hypothetical protein